MTCGGGKMELTMGGKKVMSRGMEKQLSGTYNPTRKIIQFFETEY
jgi:hypothetical protein